MTLEVTPGPVEVSRPLFALRRTSCGAFTPVNMTELEVEEPDGGAHTRLRPATIKQSDFFPPKVTQADSCVRLFQPPELPRGHEEGKIAIFMLGKKGISMLVQRFERRPSLNICLSTNEPVLTKPVPPLCTPLKATRW